MIKKVRNTLLVLLFTIIPMISISNPIDIGQTGNSVTFTQDTTNPNRYIISGTGKIDRSKFQGVMTDRIKSNFSSELVIQSNTVQLPDNSESLFQSYKGYFSFPRDLDVSNIFNMNSMFLGTVNLPDMSQWDTSNVITMNAMFKDSLAQNADIENWNVEKVRDMTNMFNSTFLNVDLGNWQTNSLENMDSMFYNTKNMQPKLSNFNTSKVTNMANVFYNSDIKVGDNVKDWDVSKVTTMYNMFAKTTQADPYIGNWNAESLIYANFMFHGAKKARLEGERSRNFRTPNLEYADDMFSYTRLANPDVSTWQTGKVKSMRSMFHSSESADPDVSNWDTSSVTVMSYMFYSSKAATLRKENGESMTVTKGNIWNVSKVTEMQEMFSYSEYADPEINWDATSLTNAHRMFADAKGATLDGDKSKNFNAPNLQNASQMFASTPLANPNTTTWQMGNVTNMQSMFYNTESADPDVSNWDTHSVINMSYMFHRAKAATLRKEGGESMTVPRGNGIWDVSKVTEMQEMFSETEYADPEINWNATSLINAYKMFANAKRATLDGDKSKDFKSPKLQNAEQMFIGTPLANPNTTDWQMQSVTTMKHMFQSTESANPDVSKWNTSSVTNMAYMFHRAKAAKLRKEDGQSMTVPDGSGIWDVSKVTEMQEMFSYTEYADPEINWNATSLTNAYRMFANAKRATLDGNKSKDFKSPKLQNAEQMFIGTPLANPNTTDWQMQSVTTMKHMFQSSESANPDVSKWNTSNVTNMSYMFHRANSAKLRKENGQSMTVPDGNGIWDVSKVTEMNEMFSYAEYADPEINWNATSLISANRMFLGAKRATLDGDKSKNFNAPKLQITEFMFAYTELANPNTTDWKMGNVTNMQSMFTNAKKANPDVSKWDTSNVSNMANLFNYAPVATPDISNWNLNKVTNASDAFAWFGGKVGDKGTNLLSLRNMPVINSNVNIYPRYLDLKIPGHIGPFDLNQDKTGNARYSIRIPDLKTGFVTRISKIESNGSETPLSLAPGSREVDKNYVNTYFKNDTIAFDQSFNYHLEVHVSALASETPIKIYVGQKATTEENGKHRLSEIYEDLALKNMPTIRQLENGTKLYLKDELDTSTPTIIKNIVTNQHTINKVRKVLVVEYPDGLKEERNIDFVIYPDLELINPNSSAYAELGMARIILDATDKGYIDYSVPQYHNSGAPVMENGVQKYKRHTQKDGTKDTYLSLDVYIGNDKMGGMEFSKIYEYLEKPNGVNIAVNTLDDNEYKLLYFTNRFKEPMPIKQGITINGKNYPKTLFNRTNVDRIKEVKNEDEVILKASYLHIDVNKLDSIVEGIAYERKAFDVIPSEEYIESVETKIYIDGKETTNHKDQFIVDKDGKLHGQKPTIDWENDDVLEKVIRVESKFTAKSENLATGATEEKSITKSVELTIYRNQDFKVDNNTIDEIEDVNEIVDGSISVKVANMNINKVNSADNLNKYPKKIIVDLNGLANTFKNANRVILKVEDINLNKDKSDLEDRAIVVIKRDREDNWSIKDPLTNKYSDKVKFKKVSFDKNSKLMEIEPSDENNYETIMELHKKTIYAYVDNTYNNKTDVGVTTDEGVLYDITANNPQLLADRSTNKKTDGTKAFKNVRIIAPDVSNSSYIENSNIDIDFKKLYVYISETELTGTDIDITKMTSDDSKIVLEYEKNSNLIWELKNNNDFLNSTDTNVKSLSDGVLLFKIPENKLDNLDNKYMYVQFVDKESNTTKISEKLQIFTKSDATKDIEALEKKDSNFIEEKSGNKVIKKITDDDTYLEEEKNIAEIVKTKLDNIVSGTTREYSISKEIFEGLKAGKNLRIVDGNNITYKNLNTKRHEKVIITYEDKSSNEVYVDINVYKKLPLSPKIEIIENENNSEDVLKAVIENDDNSVKYETRTRANNELKTITYKVEPNINSTDHKIGKYSYSHNGEDLYLRGYVGEYEIVLENNPKYNYTANQPVLKNSYEKDNTVENKVNGSISGNISKQSRDFWVADEKKEINLDIKVISKYPEITNNPEYLENVWNDEANKTIEVSEKAVVILLRDTDQDLIPDTIDTDDDNDGIPDTEEINDGTSDKDKSSFKMNQKYGLKENFVPLINKKFREAVSEKELKTLFFDKIGSILKNVDENTDSNLIDHNGAKVLNPDLYDIVILDSKAYGEKISESEPFIIPINIVYKDTTITSANFKLNVIDEEAPILSLFGFEEEDGKYIRSVNEGVSYSGVSFIQATDNASILIDDDGNPKFTIKPIGNVPDKVKQIIDPVENISNGFRYNLSGFLNLAGEWKDDELYKDYEFEIEVEDVAHHKVPVLKMSVYNPKLKQNELVEKQNDSEKIKIYLRVNRNIFKTKTVYLKVGDESPEAKNYVENLEDVKNLLRDENSIYWEKGIDTSVEKKPGEYYENMIFILKNGDERKVKTEIIIYDPNKAKKVLDSMYYDDTSIVERFNDKYFAKVKMGSIISILQEFITKKQVDMSFERIIGGVKLGLSLKPDKEKELLLIPFIEYENKVANHVMLGLGIKTNYLSHFIRYRLSILEKNKNDDNRLVFTNNLDLYLDVNKNLKVKDKFYITPRLGLYITAGGGRVTDDFNGYNLITKLNFDSKFEFKENNISYYLTTGISGGYKQYIYKYLLKDENSLIVGKPDGLLSFNLKLGIDRTFSNKLTIGGSAQYMGEIPSFIKEKVRVEQKIEEKLNYKNHFNVEIHTSYNW